MTMSILLVGLTSMPAETDEPGPFERLFHAMRRAINEPQLQALPSKEPPNKLTDTRNVA